MILRQALESLCKANIPGLNIAGDLVVCLRDSYSHAVNTLIHVLVDILDSLNYSTDLDINMQPELL